MYLDMTTNLPDISHKGASQIQYCLNYLHLFNKYLNMLNIGHTNVKELQNHVH